MNPKFTKIFVVLLIISLFALFLKVEFLSSKSSPVSIESDLGNDSLTGHTDKTRKSPAVDISTDREGKFQLREAPSSQTSKKYFFTAILSTCDDIGAQRRTLVRTWMSQFSSLPNLVDHVFLLDHYNYGSKTLEPFSCVEKLHQEQQTYGDLIFLRLEKEETGWTKIIYKVEKLIQHLGDHLLFDKYRYILKTDDDALVRYDMYRNTLQDQVDTPFVLAQTQDGAPASNLDLSTKQNFLTRSLFAYSGVFLSGSKVHTGGGRGDDKFLEDTGLRSYVKYAAGAGYAFSSALGRTIYLSSQAGNLSKWGNEDATFGHWASSFQHVKHHLGGIHAFGSYCTPRALIYHPIKDVNKMDMVIQAVINQQNATLACDIFLSKPQPKN